MKTRLLAVALLLATAPHLLAADPVPPPLLEISSGLPGQQVRLEWPAEAGLRYLVEKSTSLAPADGTAASPWAPVALVEATSSEAVWLDPEPTTTRAFYRISVPGTEIFSLSPPLLSTTGGTLLVTGQRLPAGSSLTLEITGLGQVSAPLELLAPGQWRAVFSFTPPLSAGAHITSVTCTDGSGLALATAGQVITVTESGRATDAPSSVPPAAPVIPTLDSSNPIPGIGIVVKRNKGLSRIASGGGDDCDDRDEFPLSGLMPAANFLAIKTKGTGADANRVFSQGPDDDCDGDDSLSLPSAARMAIRTKGTGAAHGRISPAASSLPGEVAFHTCPIEVVSPAGPSLAWVCTYRSMVPISSGHGPGWDFSYNISITPIPANSGNQAPRLLIRDGGGRADVFHRQPDGSYRCDGLFREGRFTGNTFTLTFADTGTWNFLPLDGSPASGKISTINSRHGLSLTCIYDTSGLLSQVSDSSGGRLSVSWSPTGQISSVSDHTGRSVQFTAFGGEPGGSPGDLKSISSPRLPGIPSLVGDLSFTYSSGSADPRLNHNLLSITAGANRLVEAYTYSGSSNPTDIAYDTCTGNNRHRIAGEAGPDHRTHFETLPSGDYLMSELDEVGRLTQTTFDRLHRALSVRQFTGFASPGVLPVAAPLSGKIRPGDPDFFETTFAWNADHLCTRVTHPDGTKEAITHDRELRPGCPVTERGNPRIFTLTSPLGEVRSVSCDYLPRFGTTESARPGNPIKGMTVKGGRNPGGDIVHQNRPGNPIKGMIIKGGRNPGGDVVAVVRSSGNVDQDCDGISADAALLSKKGYDYYQAQSALKSSATYLLAPPAPSFLDPVDDDCDGDDISAIVAYLSKKGYDYYQARSNLSFVTRVLTSHGQTFAWSHNERGDIVSRSSPIPGQGTLFQYLPDGRCSSVTELNGKGAPMEVTIAYGPGGISGVTRQRGSAPSLTTTFVRDDLNRITRISDPLSRQWTLSYSPEGLCTQVTSPPVPAPIVLKLAYDPAGELARCDLDHLDAAGAPVTANPAYSTFIVRNTRGRLTRIAREERPVDGSSTLDPATLGIENFSATDFTYDASGACIALTTPAACRGQTTDAVTSFVLDERRLLHRRVDGGLGNPDAVTTEHDYSPRGALTRIATIASGVPSPQTLYAYDGFNRLASVTDPMGNQSTFEYLQDGSVITEHFGELIDAPGDTNNILLARSTVRTRGGREQCDDRDPDHSGALFTRHYAHVDTRIVERFTPGSSAPAVLETTTVHRSPAGLVTSVVCNGDTRVSYEYDDLFRLVGISDGSCTLSFTLDGNDRLLVCGRTDHFRAAGIPGKTFTTTCVRDALGRVTACTDGAGNTTLATFDSLGRTTSLTRPGRATVHHSYDGTSATGDPVSVLVTCDVSGTGTAEVLSSSLVRNGELRRTTDSYGHSTLYTYDALHRLTRCDLPDGTFSTTSYDSRGFERQAVLLDRRVHQLGHDALGRITTSSWSDLPAGVLPVGPSTFVHDGLGRLVSTTQDGSTLTFTYDSCGNPLTETSDILNVQRTVQRSFSHRGRTGITYPDGRRFVESRGALGELLAISAVDPVGAPVQPPVVAYSHVGQRVHTATQANGTVTTHTYRGDADVTTDHSFDTCIRTVTRDASSAVLSDVAVFRSPDQSPVRCESLFSSAADGPGRFQTFSHDALGRRLSCLTERREVTGAPLIVEDNVAYTLDLEGRRQLATGGQDPGPYSQNSKIPPGDQQMGQYSTWPGGDLIWDDTGNLKSIHRGSVMQVSSYDAEGRFVACDNPLTGTPVSRVTYDALGRTSSLTVHRGGGLPAVTTRFLYDGLFCIQELTDPGGTGPLEPALTFVSAGGLKVCISTRDGSLYYPHSSGGSHRYGDGGGGDITYIGPCDASFTAMTGSNGAVVERIAYDDACKPVFLDGSGQPTSSGTSIGPLRWMTPESIWEAGSGLYLCPDGTFCPDFASAASSLMGGGHVTVLKAAAKGGPASGQATGRRCHSPFGIAPGLGDGSGGMATGKRTHGLPTGRRGHVTVLKAAATGGGGSSSGSKGGDHNSTRSNKTAS